MELSKEDYEKIIQSATNVKRILETLEKGDREFIRIDKRFQQNDKRMDTLERSQAVLTGKFSVLWMLIGSAVTAVANLIFWFKKG